MKIEFTPEARTSIDEIYHWIAADNPAAAERVLSRIRQAIAMLADFPELGHPGSVDGTRELLVRGLPYLVIYALTMDGTVDIIRIIHGRRNYP